VLLSIYRDCEKFGYKPTGMLRMIDEHGPIGAAKQLVAKPPSDGFARLAIEGRLDLAIESVILKNEWSDLFTEEEKAIARRRLHSR
jgi:hypothetical protein